MNHRITALGTLCALTLAFTLPATAAQPGAAARPNAPARNPAARTAPPQKGVKVTFEDILVSSAKAPNGGASTQTQKNLGDTATHEVGHKGVVSPRDPASGQATGIKSPRDVATGQSAGTTEQDKMGNFEIQVTKKPTAPAGSEPSNYSFGATQTGSFQIKDNAGTK
jgi:hypothetical protein